MSRFGIQVEQCGDGQQAVDLMKKGLEKNCNCIFKAYRLIFMDIQMPIMDGFEASKIIVNSLKQQKLNGDLNSSINEDSALTHIIALTSFTQDLKQQCFNVGIRDLCNKPLRLRKLCEILGRHFFRIEENKITEIVEQQ